MSFGSQGTLLSSYQLDWIAFPSIDFPACWINSSFFSVNVSFMDGLLVDILCLPKIPKHCDVLL